MQIQSFKDLIVWQKSMALALEVYRAIEKLPQQEKFALQSQICRAAVSIPSNIAEGHKRKTRKEYTQYLHIADGSAAELETQLLLTQGIYPHIKVDKPLGLLQEVQRMLTTLIHKLS